MESLFLSKELRWVGSRSISSCISFIYSGGGGGLSLYFLSLHLYYTTTRTYIDVNITNKH